MALGNPIEQWQPYPAAVAQIERLKNLQPGWNGHHPAPISGVCLAAAISFLARVWSEFARSVPEPTVVAPTSDGGVALEWIVKDGSVERGVEVVCLPGRYEYSIRNRDTGRLEEDSEDASPHTILFNVIKPHVANHFVRPR